ncbi:hypothetical protein F8M41_019364 [Gigaspora margarita]|uniref:Uncharacterized protein n=1 Tax=Gigaspora margarita TaxID=4874 RepID=A0A8H4EVZ2_GIGMA|nr:hypothetical protein F8M41_019880 [Gigaspora margarita]KAF0561742.1 hypothetical protein F8M41_019364 [Gigaspora margarita]
MLPPPRLTIAPPPRLMMLPLPRLMIAPSPTILNQNDNTSRENFYLVNNETWGKMSKENLERDRDNDDNDWINPGQQEEMLN